MARSTEEREDARAERQARRAELALTTNTTSPVLPNGQPNPNYRGNTGVGGPGPAAPTSTPRPSTPAPRTTPAPAGTSREKWASGHVSPKYAWKEVGAKHNLRTTAGRQAALSELKQRYPQYFANASWDGQDRLVIGGTPHRDFNGITTFDVIRDVEGAATPRWGTPQQDAINRQIAAGQTPTPTQPTPTPTPTQPVPTTPTPTPTTPVQPPPGQTPVQPITPPNFDDWFTQTAPDAYTAPTRPDDLVYTAPERPDAIRDPYVAPVWNREFDAPDRPDYLQGEYVAPTWNETFEAPDADSLYQDPGVQARLEAAQKAFERSAAARGSILSGGSQVALGRQQQTLAADEYNRAFGRALTGYQQRYGQFQDAAAMGAQARGINEDAYGRDVANARSEYDSAYQGFQGNAALGLAARQANESAYQDDVTNAMNQYQQRYGAFQDQVAQGLNQYNTRYRAYQDAINNQFRLSQLGLQAATAGRP